MHSLKTSNKKAGLRVRSQGPATTIEQRTPYMPPRGLSSPKSENLRLCRLDGCSEPRCGRTGFCLEHERQFYRESYRSRTARYRTWFDQRREAVIQTLLAASTPSEQAAIQRGRVEGRKLRQLAEAL